MNDRRICLYANCRAWPKHGSVWCSAHQNGRPTGYGGGAPAGNRNARGHGAPCGNQNHRIHGAYSGYVRLDLLMEALALPVADLRPEIAATRTTLQHILQAQLAPDDRAQNMVTIMRVLMRVIQRHQSLQIEASYRDLLAALGAIEPEQALPLV